MALYKSIYLLTYKLKGFHGLDSTDLTMGTLKLHSNQRRRAIEALEARAPQYCDCGPDWPLLFKVHEI